jgi:two-component system response regulator DevR
MMRRTRGRGTIESERMQAPPSRSSRQTRVLIADGQEIVRIGVRAILEREPDFLILRDTATLADTLSEARRAKADVVLLECEFSDGSGAKACRQLIEDNSSIRVIMLTLSDAPSMFHAAIGAGIHGYVLKDVSCTELVRAVRVVAGGASYLHLKMVGQAFSAWKDGPEAGRESGLHRLSPQERRIMPLVADGKTNKEIAVDLCLSDKTVKNYLMHMFKKLQITRRSQAATLHARAHRRGVAGAV